MSVDELGELGMERMTEREIRDFLSNQGFGVLALPDDGVPYVLPMSFGFDGEDSLYFTYLLGTDSRKEQVSEAADVASLLVYRADSPFHWESAVLTGPLEALPEAEWEDCEAALENAWSPSLFEKADLSRGVRIYELRIDRQSGYRHTGLPPGFER